MSGSFEYINVLEKIASSVKEFLPPTLLIDGEMSAELETYIGNDFTQKFDKYLKTNLPEEEYLKIELAIGQSQETEWFLKYHEMSESILSSIDSIEGKASVFSNQYLRELDYSELSSKFGTPTETITAPVEVQETPTFEEVITAVPDIVVPVELKTATEQPTVPEVQTELPSIENTINTPVDSTTLRKSYSISDDEDEDDMKPITSISIIDRVVVAPDADPDLKSVVEPTILEPTIEQATVPVEVPVEVDVEAMRASYGIGSDSSLPKEVEANPLSQQPPVIADLPVMPSLIIPTINTLSEPVKSPGFSLPKLGDLKGKNPLSNMNLGGGLSMLLDKKVMMGIFVVLVIVGSVLYPKFQKDGANGVKESVQSITSQVNSKVGKVDIGTLEGTATLEYSIFSEASGRSAESDSKRTLSTKTVDELNGFLSDSLTKLKANPQGLQKLAGMTIRIFSIDGKKTLVDVSVKDFVLKRRQ